MMCNGLKKIYGDTEVLCQGVGNAYTASITDNVGGKGTSNAAIKEATKMFTTAASKCPSAILAFGGYRLVHLFPARLTSAYALGIAKAQQSCTAQSVLYPPPSKIGSLAVFYSEIPVTSRIRARFQTTPRKRLRSTAQRMMVSAGVLSMSQPGISSTLSMEMVKRQWRS
jgi:hypothetical protein